LSFFLGEGNGEGGGEWIRTLFLQDIRNKRRGVTGRKRSEDDLTQGAPYGNGDRKEEREKDDLNEY
jgi:hypothetical protein